MAFFRLHVSNSLSVSLSLAFGCNRLPEKTLEIQSGLQGKGYLDLTEEVTWNQWSGGMMGGSGDDPEVSKR